MHRFLLFASILGLLTLPSLQLAAQGGSDSAKIRDLEISLTDAYKQRHFDLLASLLDDDFVITFENGNVYGKTGYISFSGTSSIRVDVAEMSDLKIRMHGNTSVVTGWYHEVGVDKGGPYDYRDRFTDVWMKSGGKWLLVASHYGIPAKP